jgi:salicylate hydroxylase
MKKKIIIIGSGIAGLTLANLLKKNSDYEFVIYEKETNLNLTEGYGVQLSVNSTSILNKVGFEKINSKEKYFPSKLDFYSFKFDKICDLDLSQFNNIANRYVTIKRSILIKFLRDELFSNSVIFGKKIKNIDKSNKRIRVNFFDNSFDVADYLVVSDGIFSDTKSIVEERKISPIFYGSIAIRNTVKINKIASFNLKNISLILAPGAHIVLYPFNNQNELNLVCVARCGFEEVDKYQSILEKKILSKNRKLLTLFQGDLKSWPIYTSSKPFKSRHKNIFYIGDAFYAFPPTMAQGASQSIEAANELFELLNENHENIDDKYFTNRLKRTRQINKRSNLNYFAFHLSNPVFILIRNFLMKTLLKSKSFKESYLGKIFRK